MVSHKRILIVDDDEAIREFLSDALTDEGYEVVVTSNGVAGLDMVGDFAPDLILLDMLMPKMDGIDFIASYKRLSHSAPIIGISAKSTTEDYANKIGIDDFLDKPFDLDELLHRIEMLIR